MGRARAVAVAANPAADDSKNSRLVFSIAIILLVGLPITCQQITFCKACWPTTYYVPRLRNQESYPHRNIDAPGSNPSVGLANGVA